MEGRVRVEGDMVRVGGKEWGFRGVCRARLGGVEGNRSIRRRIVLTLTAVCVCVCVCDGGGYGYGRVRVNVSVTCIFADRYG